jgi:hypothetical protein
LCHFEKDPLLLSPCAGQYHLWESTGEDGFTGRIRIGESHIDRRNPWSGHCFFDVRGAIKNAVDIKKQKADMQAALDALFDMVSKDKSISSKARRDMRASKGYQEQLLMAGQAFEQAVAAAAELCLLGLLFW